MNVFGKTLLAVMLFVTANSASAIEVSFDFTVFSSGSSIYPCNAGIKHANTNQVVCYERTNPQQSCNPNACEAGQSCDCVCTGTDGRSNVDFLTVAYADWSDHDESYPSSRSASFKAGNRMKYLFGNEDNSNGAKSGNYFDKQLTSLSFNLGTETFGAEYTLDVCFRGPQVDYASAGIKTNWVAESEATIQDMIGYKSYAAIAGLEVSSEIVCDYQVAGMPNSIDFVPNATQFGSGNSLYDLINTTDLGLNDVVNSSVNVTGPGKTSPTFCRVRYSFSEGKNLLGKDLFRPWKKQAAKVCTRTSVEDPDLAE